MVRRLVQVTSGPISPGNSISERAVFTVKQDTGADGNAIFTCLSFAFVGQAKASKSGRRKRDRATASCLLLIHYYYVKLFLLGGKRKQCQRFPIRFHFMKTANTNNVEAAKLLGFSYWSSSASFHSGSLQRREPDRLTLAQCRKFGPSISFDLAMNLKNRRDIVVCLLTDPD